LLVTNLDVTPDKEIEQLAVVPKFLKTKIEPATAVALEVTDDILDRSRSKRESLLLPKKLSLESRIPDE
jgi:hypothetical protein